MPRLARAVVPGLPHHVTQRGNRRQKTFFQLDDYLLYMALMGEECERFGVEILAYCLMPNHVHLIAVPSTEEALRRAVGEAHRRYTQKINQREGWRGYLWQGRFASFVMDERHTRAAARYIEMNPVRAGLVQRADDYPWSSARAHVLGRDDALATVAPLLQSVDDWRVFLATAVQAEESDQIRAHETTGRPLGADGFIDQVEKALGRLLRPRKPGPAPSAANDRRQPEPRVAPAAECVSPCAVPAPPVETPPQPAQQAEIERSGECEQRSLAIRTRGAFHRPRPLFVCVFLENPRDLGEVDLR
jgi:putative transposase